MVDAPVPTANDTGLEADEHPLALLLRTQGLERVAIVDDFYNPIEELELNPGDATDLWGLLEFEEAAHAELAKLGHVLSGPGGLTGSVLASFLSNRDECPLFDAQWRLSKIGQGREEQSAQLTRIEAHLHELLGLSVATFGSDSSAEEIAEGDAQLLLIDWRLGEDHETAIDAAVQKARDIHAHWPTERPRPLIVLMSSDPSVTNHAEEFRRRTGLLAGMFHAVPKADLSKLFSLQMHLQSLAMSLPAGYRVQAFVDALREKVKTTGDEFIERISALTLSDYAYIQSLSLQADGQPLGDYLTWLFSAYFGHLLFGRALREERDELDVLTFAPLPSQAMPSPQLAEMYRLALFDVDVGKVTTHPRAVSQRTGAVEFEVGADDVAAGVEDAADPMLSLGDVFVPVALPTTVEKTKAGMAVAPGELIGTAEEHVAPQPPVLAMVINAQCDLAFAPEGGRTIERSRSILLLPGALHPVREPIPERYKDAPRTELYEHEGRSYRILWDTKGVKAVPYGEFRRWHDGPESGGAELTRHERTARLRLPFALQVQRAFAAELTRVGMPVAPPIYQSVNVRLLNAIDKRFDHLEQPGESEEAFLVLARDGHKVVPQCVLTLPLVQRLRRIVDDRLTAMRRALDASPEDTKLQVQVDALHKALENHVEWSKLLSPTDMPTETKPKVLVAGYVHLVYNKMVGDECTTSKAIAAVSFHHEI